MRYKTRSGADVRVRRGPPSEDMDGDVDVAAKVDLTTVDAGADADGDVDAEIAAPAATGKAKRARRNRITRNACRQCRQKKSKCDGQHPTCARCRQSDTCCTYDVSEGVTKMQSLKDQLEDKTKEHEQVSALLRVLVEANDHQATTLLARLRLAHASGQEITTNPPDYLDPTLHSSQSLASLFAIPSISTTASHPYSHASSIATQSSSLDTDPTRFVSSPEDPSASFTHWDGQHTHKDYDTTSSHTTGSPGSAGYDASSSAAVQHHELSSPNATANGGFELDLDRRMSSTMAGWPYAYVTGAAGGPGYYPPMGAAGSEAEVHDWAGAGGGEPGRGMSGSGYGMMQQQPNWSGQ